MAVAFGFYDAVNGDRRHKAEEFSRLFEGIIRDGVFASIGTSLVVEAVGGMDVAIGVGRAWFENTWIDNDSPYVMKLDPAHISKNRIDAVVIEVDKENRETKFKVIKGGEVGGAAENPTLTEHQYPLAYISVGLGVHDIIQANVLNTVGTEACPFISGILETITIEGVTVLLEDEFNRWFDGVKGQLGEDPAGNLQNQINELVNELNTDIVPSIYERLNGMIYTAVYTQSDTFYIDEASKYKIICIGRGGAGVSTPVKQGGASGGYVEFETILDPGEYSINITNNASFDVLATAEYGGVTGGYAYCSIPGAITIKGSQSTTIAGAGLLDFPSGEENMGGVHPRCSRFGSGGNGAGVGAGGGGAGAVFADFWPGGGAGGSGMGSSSIVAGGSEGNGRGGNGAGSYNSNFGGGGGGGFGSGGGARNGSQSHPGQGGLPIVIIYKL